MLAFRALHWEVMQQFPALRFNDIAQLPWEKIVMSLQEKLEDESIAELITIPADVIDVNATSLVQASSRMPLEMDEESTLFESD